MSSVHRGSVHRGAIDRSCLTRPFTKVRGDERVLFLDNVGSLEEPQ